MPKLVLETSDSEKPILFIVGENNPLILKLIDNYKNDFKIAFVSSSYISATDIYRVDPANAKLIKNLKEKIDFGIVLCDDIKIKEYIGPIFEKFAQDATKTVILCDHKQLFDFQDVALAIQKAPTFNFFLTGDIYSQDPEFNQNSETAALINDALFNKEVRLFGNDIKPLYPIYLDDAITAISQILLGPKTKNKYYFLFYSNPQTYISAVHVLQRIEPDLNITYQDQVLADRYADFSEFKKDVEEKIGEKFEFLDKHLEGFEKSIQNFIERGPIKNSTPAEEDIVSIIAGPKRVLKENKAGISLFTKAVFLALFLFIIAELTSAAASLLLFKSSISNFKNGQYENAASDAKNANTFLNLVEPAGSLVSQASAKLGAQNIATNFSLYSQGVSLTNIAGSDIKNLSGIQNGILGDNLNRTIADAVFLYFKSQQLSSEEKNLPINKFITSDLSNILSLAQVAPQVLGFDHEKHYLLLFQNNGELRPTGGFIGSVGELTVKNGKVESIDLQDVYSYDGQLKVHVEPYYIVRRFLQPHLYLRDSNFDPDFQNSAEKAALLYNLESGKKVDGVIAVNFNAVKKVIGAIGPITLSSYNKTLDENNSFDFLESTIDNHFFPGSTQKKDVIQALFDKIMLTLNNKNDFVKVASLLPQMASQKDILFAFNQNSVQNIFSALGLSGEIKDVRKIDSSSINDFLAINEANIGVNKANIGVTRTIDYTVNFTNRNFDSKVTDTISNQSAVGYNAFVRFIVPLGSSLKSIKIDGADQKIIPAITDPKIYERRGFVAPSGLEVNQENENGKAIFGFQINVDPKKNQIIEVNYANGATVPSSSIVNYSLLFLKQPGTSEIPFSLNLVYGSNFIPKEVNDATLENGVVIIKNNINSDKELDAQLLRR